MSEPNKSFFQTFTGVVTAITSLIIALTGLYAATDGFNFASKSTATTQDQPLPPKDLDQSHQNQLAALKRQQEIDRLRLEQEKQALVIEKELAALRAQKEQLRQHTNESLNPVLDTLPDSIEPSGSVDLSGNWIYRNAAGSYTFVFTQQGDEIFLQEFDAYGNNVGNGSGYIQGSDVLLNWVEPYLFVMSLEVQAELSLNAQRDTLVGKMFAQDSVIPVTFYRQ